MDALGIFVSVTHGVRMSNSPDPDETTHYAASHLDPDCLQSSMWRVLTLCACVLVAYGQAPYTAPMEHHASWSEGRRPGVFRHYTCTMVVTQPLEYFSVTIKLSSRVTRVQVWSMDLFEENYDDSVFAYQSKRTMYPPRIVLNFHVGERFSGPVPNGTCEWKILSGPVFPKEADPQNNDEVAWGVPGLEEHPWALPDPNEEPNQLGGGSSEACSMLNQFFSNLDNRGPHPPTGQTPTAVTLADPDSVLPIARPFPQPVPRPAPRLRRMAIPDIDIQLGPIEETNEETSEEPAYLTAIQTSMHFFDAQRSGMKERYDREHVAEWIRSTGLDHVAPDGTDLIGGWFNGNDLTKINLPMASSVTLLAWGFYLWPEAYSKPDMELHIVETLKWPLDYFLKCWNKDTETLYVQVGDLKEDRAYFERSDSQVYTNLVTDNKWPFYKATPENPASDVAAEMAAAMTLSSMAFGPLEREEVPDSYKIQLFETALELYHFAVKYQGVYSDFVPQSSTDYPTYTSSGYHDELCLAAVLIYGVNYNDTYLEHAEQHFEHADDPMEFFSWDNKFPACAILLRLHTGDTKYERYVIKFLDGWIYGIYTLGKLAYRSALGPLRYTANAALLALIADEYKIIEDFELMHEAQTFSIHQTNYMLGLNPANKSYLIGFGENYPRNPFHKTSACSHPAKPCGWQFYNSEEVNNVHDLTGALVGGPNINDEHVDSRTEKIRNSVAIDYNAGFQSALAGLHHLQHKSHKQCFSLEGTSATDWPSTTENTTPFTSYSSTASTTSTPGSTKTTKFTTTQSTAIPAKPTSYNYADALGKSILFYEAQRDGPLPADYPISWRSNFTAPFGGIGKTLVGGWFDDGSVVKTTIAMATSASLLGWGGIQFKSGYQQAGELDNFYDSLRCPLQYFLDMWSQYNTVYVKNTLNDGQAKAYWSRPGDMDAINSIGYFFRALTEGGQGADVAADVATAMAIGSQLFAEKDAEFSYELATAAEAVYDFATSLNGVYNAEDDLQYTGNAEASDELCLSSAWVYKITKNITYKQAAKSYRQIPYPKELTWSNKHVLCELALYELTGHSKYSEAVKSFLDHWSSPEKEKTPQGLALQSEDGPLRHAANAAFVTLLAAEQGIGEEPGKAWAKSQINYMLGKNDFAYSYLIGYGNRYPRRPHHRGSSCPDYMEECDWSIYNAPGANPNLLKGALVSGPNSNDFFEDARTNYTMNRVAVDYNAGFQSVLAGLIKTYGTVSIERTPSSTTTTTTIKPSTPTKPPPTKPTAITVKTTKAKPETETTKKLTTEVSKPEIQTDSPVLPNGGDGIKTNPQVPPESSGSLGGISKGTSLAHLGVAVFMVLLFTIMV